MKQKTPDVKIENGGSIMLVRPLTDAAREWIGEHVQLESWQWLGDAFACEPRYLGNLLDGMRGEGLVIE